MASPAVRFINTPTRRGVPGSRARATSGLAIAALPKTVINVRRLIASPRLRTEYLMPEALISMERRQVE
jgi:hypothetical protein